MKEFNNKQFILVVSEAILLAIHYFIFCYSLQMQGKF